MQLLDEIRGSNKKPKELLLYLSKKIKEDNTLLGSFREALQNGTPAEKGTCMEVMEFLSKEDPSYAKHFVSDITKYLSFDSPRVKWESARIIANIASKYPEKNNGVKNVYIKALKDINK